MARRRGRQAKKSAALRRYRALYARAKKAGLVRGDKDARSIVPSGYMKSRLNKLEQYLDTSKYVYMKADAPLRKFWRRKENWRVPMIAGDKMVVRVSAKEQVKIVKKKGTPDRLKIFRKLKNGEMELIPLPVRVNTYQELLEAIEKHPYLFEAKKYKDETFAFTVNGFPTGNQSLHTAEDLVWWLQDYNMVTENHSINNPSFELYRHKNDWNFPAHYRAQLSAQRRRMRSREYERKLTPEQREERNARRAYARQFQPSYKRQLAADRARYDTDEYREQNRQRMRERRKAQKGKGKKK